MARFHKGEKFAYQKFLLIGQADNVVSGSELTSDNYTNCVKSLKERFGKRDTIMNSSMDKILNLESIKYSSNVRGLRKLYDQLDVSVKKSGLHECYFGFLWTFINTSAFKTYP
ncbi:putative pao retrotransposon peptidase superfamily [Trichonephila inaurata madagascariensis]|uniref:Putative pao retrotransposon peptidase superfamily n=1 Tax=Trichonephila inaurata madagascariensis TaxID=2747483 RepID=A0A8X6WSG7_9ARAC|nr:putative pao retrotransposon peptidase superfamily [Trichonephila inaurata madagascariensis]